MQQFMAPRILKVNGDPSPCECREGVVCAYCVQASLIMWERKEQPEEAVETRVLKAMKKVGPRKTGRLLRVDHKTVSHWIKAGRLSAKYLQEAQGVFGVAT